MVRHLASIRPKQTIHIAIVVAVVVKEEGMATVEVTAVVVEVVYIKN